MEKRKGLIHKCQAPMVKETGSGSGAIAEPFS